MNNIIKRKWNQNSMVIIEDLQGMAFQAESGGHTFQISGIDGEGNTVALSGTPAGVMLRADGQDVTLTCSVSGGVVSATLPANAYSVPGRFGLTIFLTSDGQKTAIYAAVGTVSKTSSGTVAPPAGSDVVDLVNAIAAAVATIPASYTDLMAAMAPTYSSSGLYAVGSYAWYNGKLYRCTTAITSGETWTSGHWTLANLGSDLVDLKSAFLFDQYSGIINNETWVENVTANATITSGKRIKKDGTIVDDAAYNVATYTASKENKYIVTLQYGATYNDLTAIQLIQNSTVIAEKKPTKNTIEDTLIKDFTGTIKVCYRAVDTASFFLRTVIDGTDKSILNLEQTTDTIMPEIKLGKYINASGVLTTLAGWEYVEFVSVKQGDRVLFKAYSNNTAIPLAVFYDNSGTMIRAIRYGSADTSDYEWVEYIVPSDGKMQFCSHKNLGYSLYVTLTKTNYDAENLLSGLFDAERIDCIFGGYIKADGTVGTDYKSNYYTDFVSVENGDLIVFKCYSANTTYSLITKYDTSKVFDKQLINIADSYKWRFVKFTEAGYVRLSSFTATYPILAYKIPARKSGFVGISADAYIENYFKHDQLPRTQQSGFLKNDGTYAGAGSWYSLVTDVIPCNAGDRFHYTGYNGSSAVGYLLYNSGDIIGYHNIGATMGTEDIDVTIPEGVDGIRFSSTASSSATVSLFAKRIPIYRNEGNVTTERSILYGKKVTVIGDSITHHNFTAKTNWAMYFANWTGCIVQNLGIQGTGFAKLDPYINRINQISGNPDIIGVAISFNDMAAGFPVGTKTDTGTSSIAGYANAFFDALITAYPTTPIICYAQSPWGALHPGGDRTDDDDYVKVIGEICELKGIPYYPEAYYGCVLKPWIDANKNYYYKHDDETSEYYEQVDNVHPNSEGHKVIARYLYPHFATNIVDTGLDYYVE